MNAMHEIHTVEGHYDCPDARFGIAVSRFNAFITEPLLMGALDVLHRHAVPCAHIEIVRAPGAFELPLVVQRMAGLGQYDAIIALGCVIRGGTPHFEYVANETTKGLAAVMLDQEIPIAFGVLTTDNIEQAIERAGTKAGNKGAEAAFSALEMVSLMRQLVGGPLT